MCDCKTKIEAELLTRFKAKHPDATAHSAELMGYGFAVRGNEMLIRPYMDIKFGAGHASKKTGLERWKAEKGTMAFRFCPFCGENLLADTKTPNAELTGLRR